MPSEAPPERRGPFGSRTFRIGRLFGIDVGIDPSWFFVFVLFTLSFGSEFQTVFPEWGLAMAYGGALLTSLLYFGSILAHELGHSVISQSLGLPVRSITLFLLGGLAQLSGEPERPRDEFLIAIAGPAVSFLLGLGFLGLWMASPDGSFLGQLGVRLGSINIALTVFNMIPGFPLDGGHVFRSFLWAATGDRDRSTRWAALAGSLFARLLIALGIGLALFGGSVLGGVFMGFVGWFLLRVAQASGFQARLREVLSRVNVGEVMHTPAHVVDTWTTAEDVAEAALTRHGSRQVFVEDEGRLLGVLGLEQILAIDAERRGFLRVTEVMTELTDLATIGPRENLFAALERMEREDSVRLLVVHEGAVLGVIAREDITRAFQSRSTRKT